MLEENSVYSAERKQEILKLIQKDTRVTVVQLAELFQVSRATIRRDLGELRRVGLLQRTYGGAISAGHAAQAGPNDGVERPFLERKAISCEEKKAIGQAAAKLVRPGDTIFLDGGTTIECMTSFLVDIPHLTVITSGLNIAMRLVGNEGITVIVIGGTLHHRSLLLTGVLATEFIQGANLHFDTAFIAASAVSAAAGVTNASLEEIPIKRQAVAAARQVVLLADSSKLGRTAAMRVVPAERIHRLITDAKAPVAEVEALRQLGVVVDLV